MSTLRISVTDAQLAHYRRCAAAASLPLATWMKSVLGEAPESPLFDAPFGAEAAPRDRQVNLKLTVFEHAHLKECARASEHTLSAYVRRAALRGRPPRSVPEKLTRDTLRALDRIGTNLNQVARKLNAASKRGSSVVPPTLGDVTAVLARVSAWIEAHGG